MSRERRVGAEEEYKILWVEEMHKGEGIKSSRNQEKAPGKLERRDMLEIQKIQINTSGSRISPGVFPLAAMVEPRKVKRGTKRMGSPDGDEKPRSRRGRPRF